MLIRTLVVWLTLLYMFSADVMSQKAELLAPIVEYAHKKVLAKINIYKYNERVNLQDSIGIRRKLSATFNMRDVNSIMVLLADYDKKVIDFENITDIRCIKYSNLIKTRFRANRLYRKNVEKGYSIYELLFASISKPIIINDNYLIVQYHAFWANNNGFLDLVLLRNEGGKWEIEDLLYHQYW